MCPYGDINGPRAVTKNPTRAAFGGIFRDSNNVCHGYFAQNLTTQSTFIAEISGVLKAIEIAAEKNWNNIWLEIDS